MSHSEILQVWEQEDRAQVRSTRDWRRRIPAPVPGWVDPLERGEVPYEDVVYGLTGVRCLWLATEDRGNGSLKSIEHIDLAHPCAVVRCEPTGWHPFPRVEAAVSSAQSLVYLVKECRFSSHACRPARILANSDRSSSVLSQPR